MSVDRTPHPRSAFPSSPRLGHHFPLGELLLLRVKRSTNHCGRIRRDACLPPKRSAMLSETEVVIAFLPLMLHWLPVVFAQKMGHQAVSRNDDDRRADKLRRLRHFEDCYDDLLASLCGNLVSVLFCCLA